MGGLPLLAGDYESGRGNVSSRVGDNKDLKDTRDFKDTRNAV